MEYVLTIIRGPRLGQLRLKRVAVNATKVAARHLHDHFIPHARNNYHPHVLGHRALALFSALLVVLKIFTLALLTFGPVIPAFSSAISVDNIIALTNQSRESYQLKDLTESSVLDKAAQAKADDMLAKGYFSHNTPDGKTPWDFITGVGYNYIMAGENLAVNFTEAENVEQAWMNSPGHKANILNKDFEEIGIGISQGEYQDHTAIFVVQMFGTPVEQKISLTDMPTKVQTQAVPAPPQPTSDAVPTKISSIQPDTEPAVPAQDITIQDAQVTPAGDLVNISAQISANAVKAIAYFGQKGVMLQPRTGGSWQGQVPLSDLALENQTVKIQAFDMAGRSSQVQLADFSSSTIGNFNVLGASSTASSTKATWLGITFDPRVFEQKFYLLFIASLTACLILAIGIKRHIQHLPLVANSSFVIMLATLLWFAG